MADIELVIKIDEEDYKKVLDTNNRECEWNNMHRCYEAVLNGTPVPKGHGRLIILSEDIVKREQCAVSFSRQNWISEVGLSNATVAIIEADKEKTG